MELSELPPGSDTTISPCVGLLGIHSVKHTACDTGREGTSLGKRLIPSFGLPTFKVTRCHRQDMLLRFKTPWRSFGQPWRTGVDGGYVDAAMMRLASTARLAYTSVLRSLLSGVGEEDSVR
ncbi:hypothetical protein ACRALDRAFT_2037323 [Sodiomyces alcalophilus JCM 7366]|uniref:uncharacterized protein n=1 Tax=Sodiomyces alcalophilus JCM 7366 TaxID=591952 RepID=UPI0039B4A2D1